MDVVLALTLMVSSAGNRRVSDMYNPVKHENEKRGTGLGEHMIRVYPRLGVHESSLMSNPKFSPKAYLKQANR